MVKAVVFLKSVITATAYLLGQAGLWDESDAQLKANLALLEKQWRMTGAAAAGAVKRTPRILGNTVDCEGDCIGECDRCWVRF